jgi:hypothetical protein
MMAAATRRAHGERAHMGDKVRFDDRIATVLAWEPRTPADCARVWHQLVDLIGHASDADEALVNDAVARLSTIQGNVLLPVRRRAIAALDYGQVPQALLAHLSHDAAAYGGLLPRTPEPRPPEIAPIEEAEEAAPVAASQITDLLARIDAFKARREEPAESNAGFAFQIDEAGALHALDGASLLAHCAEPPQGVDGQAAGAWRLGAPFADARLVIDSGPHAGEWRISADPILSEGGRTIGYRGIARAPRADETAVVPTPVDPMPTVHASRLDAAIDRLRDPLEAIVTVADPETLPPGEIRVAAGEVISRSAALSAAIDTLELAVAAAGDGGLDAAALLVRIDAALQPLAEARGLKISFRLASGLPPVDADPQAVERMVARLIGAIVSLGRRGERIVARLGRDRADGRMLALSVTRPGRLLGWPPYALLDPPPLPDADAPELGLGFALRLVDRLAQEAGGRLAIHDDRIVLSLPLPPEPRALRAHRS